MRKTFKGPEFFRAVESSYRLAPFRYATLPGIADRILVTNDVGEFHFLGREDFEAFQSTSLPAGSSLYMDLRSKHFITDEHHAAYRPLADAQYESRKSFLDEAPALHIFVVSLRCHHSCPYCQVSRQTQDKATYDMSEQTAAAAVDLMFQCPSPYLKVEFQGGEPLLAFDRIKFIVQRVADRNRTEKRRVEYVIATTLNDITAEQLAFCKHHGISLSTSLDGPEDLHDTNRPRQAGGSYRRTLAGIDHARGILGDAGVSALLTVTRASLSRAEEIVEAYAQLGFASIFVRSLSPYGFARRSERRLGYTTKEFLTFYDQVMAKIISINLAGYYLEEVYTTILLQHILTPFSTGYVDLRSPTGALFGTLVYNYDGAVFASDEARMLAEDGDFTFQIGTVSSSYSDLFNSDAARLLYASGIAEETPGCMECAFLPYCGSDPVHHHASQGSVYASRLESQFCQKQTYLFQRLFGLIEQGHSDTLKVMTSWLSGQKPALAATGFG